MSVVLSAVLLLGMLTACESTGHIVSSTTSEEEVTTAEILPPTVEEGEEFEAVVEETEVASVLSEPIEEDVELAEQDVPQPQPEPVIKTEPLPENDKTIAPAAPTQKQQRAVPTPQVPASVKPQKAVPPDPVRPTRLQDVYFDFDEATILSPAKPILEANANLLQTRFKHRNILIEGHCDERGSVEYNLVLGVRRAQVVKAYLIDLGIPQSRIRIVSYGKERPVCSERNDSCWQRNRRTHFVLQ